MSKHLVATLAIYAIVDANDETEARALGQAALYDLYAEVRERQGRDVPINIVTVRLATEDEIELMAAHDENLARETARRAAVN